MDDEQAAEQALLEEELASELATEVEAEAEAQIAALLGGPGEEVDFEQMLAEEEDSADDFDLEDVPDDTASVAPRPPRVQSAPTPTQPRPSQTNPPNPVVPAVHQPPGPVATGHSEPGTFSPRALRPGPVAPSLEAEEPTFDDNPFRLVGVEFEQSFIRARKRERENNQSRRRQVSEAVRDQIRRFQEALFPEMDPPPVPEPVVPEEPAATAPAETADAAENDLENGPEDDRQDDRQDSTVTTPITHTKMRGHYIMTNPMIIPMSQPDDHTGADRLPQKVQTLLGDWQGLNRLERLWAQDRLGLIEREESARQLDAVSELARADAMDWESERQRLLAELEESRLQSRALKMELRDIEMDLGTDPAGDGEIALEQSADDSDGSATADADDSVGSGDIVDHDESEEDVQ